jgi:DNA modification methylase
MKTVSGATQLLLFDGPNGNAQIFDDPAFASNKNAPVHRWVPWIAGFSREFVRSAIEQYLHKRGTVLDPFAGVGTTLVEAALAGHKVIGFEINPYAAFACRTKLTAYRLDVGVVEEEIRRFRQFYEDAMREPYTPQSIPPPGFKTRSAFYSRKVLQKVLTVQDFITSQKENALLDVFRLAFASTMVTYSNYSYEPSLTRRAAVGRDDIEDFPVGEVIVAKLREMGHDIQWINERLKGSEITSQVFSESFFESWKKLPASSIDLLITSPPYLNNYHYNRNTRPHLYWLGLVQGTSDLKRLEEQNFGKFWQTVRERACVSLDFPADKEIIECVQTLRAKTPEKGIYGGNGWANYAASYFNDCYRFAQAAQYALKRGSTALVVIGNSILQGEMVPTDKYLAKIAEAVGLELVDIHMPRHTRVGSSIIQSNVRVVKAKKADTLYEAVVELRKR